MKNFNKFASRYGMALVLVGLIIFFSFASEFFLTQQNLTNVLRQVAMLGIASVGMTLVVLTGGIDLSVGSTIALVGVVTALCMSTLGLDMYSAALLGILTGAVWARSTALPSLSSPFRR